jgi:hypothetical protein
MQTSGLVQLASCSRQYENGITIVLDSRHRRREYKNAAWPLQLFDGGIRLIEEQN